VTPLVPYRAPPPEGTFRALLVVPGLSAALALLAGWLAGVTAARGETGPGALATAAALLAAAGLVATGALLLKLRRRFDEDRLRTAALAITDELTGVGTRRFVLDRLGEELGRARRYGRVVSCTVLDVDGLGRLNASVGAEGGDAVLRAAAGAVRAQLRGADVVGRIRDDELLVILPETDGPSARLIAGRLRLAVASLQVLHGGLTLEATCSLGVVTYDPAAEREAPEVEGILRRADEALHAAKAAGRNQVAG
jgi:diguanylate cyclase (GGDEF)-like protein